MNREQEQNLKVERVLAAAKEVLEIEELEPIVAPYVTYKLTEVLITS